MTHEVMERLDAVLPTLRERAQETEDLRRLPVAPTAGTDRGRAWHPSIAHSVELPVLSLPSAVERPSDGGVPGQLAPPVAISGRIGEPGERDEYRFTARKGETWRLRVVARPLGAVLDPQFNTTDVCIVVKTDLITAKYSKHYERKLAGPGGE